MIQQPNPVMVQDNSDNDVSTQPQTASFNQQAFGPWSNLDPLTKRSVVRTNVSSGSTRNRFLGTYPPAPTIAQQKTAITGGYEFTINIVSGSNTVGYNVYSSLTNNAAVAKLIGYVPQPSVNTSLNSIKYQDITATNPYYWVASVNSVGRESARIPAAGVAAPTPPATSPAPIGGGSGSGSGGGGGKGGVGGRRPSGL